MKRIFAIATAILLVLTTLVCFGISAADGEKVNVKVSITTKDALRTSLLEIAVGDEDGDGAITVNDALYAAHELAYIGGAEYGYAAEKSEWGISLLKLWGDESGNFGYYVNHKPANSLADPVKDGDVVSACIFTGTYPDIESYAYFDVDSVKVSQGDSVTLTLMKLSFDENFNVVSSPVANAKLTTDSSPWADYVTDENGKVTFEPMWLAEMTVSAIGENKEIIMPACKVWVDEAPQNSDLNNSGGSANAATDANGNKLPAASGSATDGNGSAVGSQDASNEAAGGCGGCGSSLGGASVIVAAVIGVSACVIKRRERD